MQSFLFWLFRDIFSCVLCCHYLVRKSLEKCSIFMGTLLQVFVKHSVLEIQKSRVCNSVNHIFLLQVELKSTSLFCQPLWMWQEDGMYHFFNPYLNKPVISVAILCCSPRAVCCMCQMQIKQQIFSGFVQRRRWYLWKLVE